MDNNKIIAEHSVTTDETVKPARLEWQTPQVTIFDLSKTAGGSQSMPESNQGAMS